jgi:hypothetical protein
MGVIETLTGLCHPRGRSGERKRLFGSFSVQTEELFFSEDKNQRTLLLAGEASDGVWLSGVQARHIWFDMFGSALNRGVFHGLRSNWKMRSMPRMTDSLPFCS